MLVYNEGFVGSRIIALTGANVFFVKPLRRFSASLVRTTAAAILTVARHFKRARDIPTCAVLACWGQIRTRPNGAKREVLEQLARAPFGATQRAADPEDRLAIRAGSGRVWNHSAHRCRTVAHCDWLHPQADH